MSEKNKKPTALFSEKQMIARWVRDAQKGDRKAFGELFKNYSSMVHGILLSKVSPKEADDLVQDVFLHALEKLSTLQNPESFGAWLATMTRRRAIDFYRTRRNTESLPENLSSEDPNRVEALQVLEKIRTLPEAYQEPLILRLVEGMSGPEIAARTGLTPESVRVNLSRGMKKLKEVLGVNT